MKRLVALLTALLASVAFASPALAYPPGAVELLVSSESPAPGSSITLTVDGFCGGSTITFTAAPGGVLGTAVADGSGGASLTVAAPSTPGTYVITATGSDCPSYYATVEITVSGGGGLPGTGSDSNGTLTLALIAVLAGAALVGVGTLRRRTPTSV